MASSSILTRHTRRRHGLGGQDLVESIEWEQPALEDQLTDGAASGDGGLGDVGRLRVADVGAERGGDGSAALEQLSGACLVGFDASNATLEQHAHRLPQDPACMQRVPRHHRHHHVQLELPAVGSRLNRGVAAIHLVANLVDHFRHGRIHLAGHDR
jgi:hypothetical protein